VTVVVAVGVGAVPCTAVSRTAWAESARLPLPLAVALYVGDKVPPKGAARSAKARVKPSLVEIVLKRCLSMLASVKTGPEPACAP
jgi:hypothetical protein